MTAAAWITIVFSAIVAAIFGVSGAMSAFTIAFQVPNLVRALFADAALQGAFVPVFTELLEKEGVEKFIVSWNELLDTVSAALEAAKPTAESGE